MHSRYQFLESRRARTEGVRNCAKVADGVVHLCGEAHPVAVRCAQGVLENGEQTPRSRKCRRHGTKFTQKSVP